MPALDGAHVELHNWPFMPHSSTLGVPQTDSTNSPPRTDSTNRGHVFKFETVIGCGVLPRDTPEVLNIFCLSCDIDY